MNNLYQQNQTKNDLNKQLLIGLKKHLQISQDTTTKKAERIKSLENVAEVLEYVVLHINEAISVEEQAIFLRFFNLLLVKVKTASVSIHTTPESFEEEIAFINILLKI